jgi:hypothetical protein
LNRAWAGAQTWEAEAAVWGDGCVVARPFLFHGDPELLARVRAALGPDVKG